MALLSDRGFTREEISKQIVASERMLANAGQLLAGTDIVGVTKFGRPSF